MPAARNQSSPTTRTAVAMAPPDPWVTPNQAAALLGRSRLQCYELALRGLIGHQLVAGRRVFARADVERLVAERESSA